MSPSMCSSALLVFKSSAPDRPRIQAVTTLTNRPTVVTATIAGPTICTGDCNRSIDSYTIHPVSTKRPIALKSSVRISAHRRNERDAQAPHERTASRTSSARKSASNQRRRGRSRGGRGCCAAPVDCITTRPMNDTTATRRLAGARDHGGALRTGAPEQSQRDALRGRGNRGRSRDAARSRLCLDPAALARDRGSFWMELHAGGCLRAESLGRRRRIPDTRLNRGTTVDTARLDADWRSIRANTGRIRARILARRPTCVM